MSAEAVSNPVPAGSESKSARKKRAKAEAVEAPPQVAEDKTPDGTNGDSYFESSYIRELQKNLRNVNKKMNAMSKLDAILAEHPGKSLDELVATRKINQDQKAQAEKKPALQAQSAQLEEQIAQYKKIDQDYQSRMTSQQASTASAHQSELEQLKQELKQQHQAELKTVVRQNLRTFSQFLRAAAAKRIIEDEADTDESKAFEGALLLVYGGDDKAVDAALSLIEGSDDQVLGVDGELLPVKFAQIKQASVNYGAFPGDEASADATEDAPADAPAETADVQPEETLGSSDPTITHAGLTELGLNQQNGEQTAEADAEPSTIAQTSTGDDGNKSAEASWDNAAAGAGPEGFSEESLKMIPRDSSETETAHEPAQPQSTNSWADQSAAPANATAQAAETPAQPQVNSTVNGLPTATDDGFHEVGRRGGRGGYRGEGRGDGRGRGRGRGGPRGGHRVFRGERGDRRGGAEGRGGNEGRGGRGRGGAPQPPAAPRS